MYEVQKCDEALDDRYENQVVHPQSSYCIWEM